MVYCKVELKLKLTKQCVLQATDVDIVNAHDNNLNFTVKDTRLYVVTYQQKTIRNFQNVFTKDLKNQTIGIIYKSNKKKKKKNGYRYFLNQTL